ncbi:hypothetical protein BU16DRAFT_23717 [Lophium mytilinum]|uniref:Uncharacterized protein n=1 Tax=Lophium mytilinum TaxID=390894 RepID=A0A6A6REQ5_9PEZI|nr:hypothetical protein BU16DRAFT_23717 [Lophium mytilinum]
MHYPCVTMLLQCGCTQAFRFSRAFLCQTLSYQFLLFWRDSERMIAALFSSVRLRPRIQFLASRHHCVHCRRLAPCFVLPSFPRGRDARHQAASNWTVGPGRRNEGYELVSRTSGFCSRGASDQTSGQNPGTRIPLR